MTSKKTIIIILLAIAIIAVAYFVFPQKTGNDLKNGETATTTTSALTAIDCKADSDCLSSNFLSCASLEFKMDFVQPGSKYIITVLGKEDDNCHYQTKVLNPDGSILMGFECKVPLTEISLDTVKHFFGQDTDAVKDAQAQLEQTYCAVLQ